ncbi:MAG: hypothetical protein AB7H88_08200 [Vicinamibacterales bacterium]
MTERQLLTRLELAEALKGELPTGPHPVSISKWVQQGMPVAERGRGGRPSRYVLADVRAWLQRRAQAAAGGAATDVAQERARYFRLQADKTDLDVRKRQGELVDVREVEERWAAIVAAVRERILSLPSAALQQGIIPPEREDALVVLCDEALTDLAARGRHGVAASAPVTSLR